jgi:hypothetical protein
MQDIFSGVCYVDGTEPIDIRRLISPLRYDVIVRQRFFSLLDDQRRLYDQDRERFMAMAAQSPYRAWFDRVYCPRFQRRLLHSETARNRAFRKRVTASAKLYFSFEKFGFISKHKIILRTGCEMLPSDSGKQVSAAIFPGDGCHRLALLLGKGVTELAPEQYVVKVSPKYSPLDNTALLLAALEVPAAEYAAFLSASFSDGRHDCLEDLLDTVARRNPQRLPELRQIIAADQRSLHAH